MTFLIGLDLDGVCYNFEKTARYMIRKRMESRGETPAPEMHQVSQNWDWISSHCPPEDWAWLWNEGAKHGLFRYGHAVHGAIDGVVELAKLGDIIAITARPKAAVHDTLAWLAMMFDQSPLAGVVIQSHDQKKSAVDPVPDVYIDDGVHNYADILENTNSWMIQFQQPWNNSYFVPFKYANRFLRAKGWAQTVECVKYTKNKS